jgi:hypothetical protein
LGQNNRQQGSQSRDLISAKSLGNFAAGLFVIIHRTSNEVERRHLRGASLVPAKVSAPVTLHMVFLDAIRSTAMKRRRETMAIAVMSRNTHEWVRKNGICAALSSF